MATKESRLLIHLFLGTIYEKVSQVNDYRFMVEIVKDMSTAYFTSPGPRS